jgi:hypothetical protein
MSLYKVIVKSHITVVKSQITDVYEVEAESVGDAYNRWKNGQANMVDTDTDASEIRGEDIDIQLCPIIFEEDNDGTGHNDANDCESKRCHRLSLS